MSGSLNGVRRLVAYQTSFATVVTTNPQRIGKVINCTQLAHYIDY